MPAPATPTTDPRRLHLFLGIGLVGLAAAFFLLHLLGIAEMQADDAFLRWIGYGFAGAVFALIAVVFVVFKPRVPGRETGQSVEEYWRRPEVSGAVLLVWFLLEGAGVLAAVGYRLTGQPLSAVVMILAVVTFWLCGPGYFANG